MTAIPEVSAPVHGITGPTKWAVAGITGALGLAVGGVCALLDGLSPACVLAGVSSGAAGGLAYLVTHLQRQDQSTRAAVRTRLGRGAASCLFTWRPGVAAWLSPRWQAVFDLEASPDAPDLSAWLDRVHPQDRARLQRGFDELARGAREELRLVHRLHGIKDWRWAEVQAIGAIEAGQRIVVGSVLDVTDRRRTEAQLAYSAFHDMLTGLPNRALFADRLSHCTARARRNPRYRFAVLFLDIDDFKVINDSLGHISGDALLGVVAERIKTCVRPGDTVARLGGDEYTILLDPLDTSAQADEIAGRLIAAVQAPCEVHGHTIQTSASIGIAFSSAAYSDPQDLLRDADTAMYRAKRDGKGMHRLFDRSMHDSAMRRLEIESELCGAIDQGGFIVHYQPIVGLTDGLIQGFEALARLPSARSGGLISPIEFIPVAEEAGMLDAILDNVLDAAARQVASWRAEYTDLYVSVNVGARSVRPDLIDKVQDVLSRYELAPSGLKLELTESVLVDGAGASAVVLESLRDLGVGLYIDDFGTGYSSLSYMHRFPVERLKIDRSFVSALDGTHMPGIVETIIDLSRRIDAEVIAEGIETEEQLLALRGLRCHAGQGYHFAPAIPAADASRLLADTRSWVPAIPAGAPLT